MHDLIVSVWNRFHSFPLIDGLTSSGLDVLGLGTTRRKPNCTEFHRCWSSALLTQASYHLPAFRKRLIEMALHHYDKFASRHVLDAPCLWGWSNHHLNAFRRAKSHGRRIILETGSTHATWQRDVVAAEYERHGMDFSAHYDSSRIEQSIKEYDLADRISVPSRFVASTFCQQGIAREKLAVNPFGVDIAFWSNTDDSGKKSGPCVFIYVAQIMLRKGIAYLLEASRRLEKNAHELWLVGGIDRDSQSLVRNLPGHIKLLGQKNHLEIRELYRRAHVFVLPSLEEGLARSLLEAMAAGLPLIATEETGITDIMVDREDGWIVPSSDADALTVAMQTAIANPEMVRERGRSATKRVAPYTWEAYGKRAASFFRDFLKQNS